MPTSYYWWSVFYRKSAFEEWGVQAARPSWDEFMALLDTLKGKGIAPLTNGTGSTPWMASGWFDYLDLRINGAAFHRDLLAGKHSFDSAEVRKVMDTYATLVPYFDPKGRSYSWQEARHAAGQQEGRHVPHRSLRHPGIPGQRRQGRRLLLRPGHRSGDPSRGGADGRLLCQREQRRT